MASKIHGNLLPQNVSEDKSPAALTRLMNSTHQELKHIDDRCQALKNEIAGLHSVSERAKVEYWVAQSKACDAFIRQRGADSFERWRVDFAAKESAEARRVGKRQAEIAAQIKIHNDEIARLTSEYWAKWEACMNVLAMPSSQASLKTRTGALSAAAGQREQRKPRNRKATRPSLPSPSPAPLSASPARASLKRKRGQDKSLRSVTVFSFSQPPTASTTPVATESPTSTPGVNAKRTKRQESSPESAAPAKVSSAGSQGITDPVPGQIYKAYYNHPSSIERGWYLGTPLPWDGDDWATDINLKFAMGDMDLKEGFPECYIPDVAVIERKDENGNILSHLKNIRGLKDWAPGFEDGGPRVQERSFLFLWFDDRKPGKLKIPKTLKLGQKMEFTKSALANTPIDWVSASNLRPMGARVPGSVRGRKTAEKYTVMRARLAALRQNGDVEMDDSAQGDVGSGSPDNSGLSNDGSSSVTWRTETVPGAPMMPEAPMIPGAAAVFGSQPQDINQNATVPQDASAAEQPDDLDGSTVLDVDAGGGSRADDSQQHHSDSPVLPDQAEQNSSDKMDVDEAYEEAATLRGSASARGDNDDDNSNNNNKFDEGVGMDYDLELAKSCEAPARLAPIQCPSPVASRHQRLPGLSEVLGAEALCAAPLPSPTFPLAGMSGGRHTPERLASIDSGWLSQGGAAADEQHEMKPDGGSLGSLIQERPFA